MQVVANCLVPTTSDIWLMVSSMQPCSVKPTSNIWILVPLSSLVPSIVSQQLVIEFATGPTVFRETIGFYNGRKIV